MTELQDLRNDIKEVLFYIRNDPRTGRKGLVKEVEDLKASQDETNEKLIDFITEYRKDQAVKRAKVGLIGAIGGAVATCLGWIITHFIK